ncbi:MAG: TonB family protein [Deltaproteobacteria bacterium]|nr:TonB family protein [Deltaproteobacteria bacterium]
MRAVPLTLALALCAALPTPACVVESQNHPSVSLEPPQVPGADLGEARFCSRQPGGAEENPLALTSLALEITTAGHTVRSHLMMVVKNPTEAQVEAALRLSIPPGAAVSRAVLHVDGRPMEGAFVQRDRARFIYRSITERRRDPALVVWSGPEWVEASIFPLAPKGGERTFELEWVEPAATAAGRIWYRLPVLAHRGQVTGRPTSVTVDGTQLPPTQRGWIALGGKVPTVPAIARRPGDPFGLILARDQAPAPASQGAPGPRVVIVAETSAAMTVELRKQQRTALTGLLEALPPGSKVSLIRADWSFTELTERAGAEAVRQALDALDAVPSAGALDLERVLDAAADRAQADGATAVVFVGQGFDSFGGDPLAAPLKKQQAARVALSVVGLPAASGPLTDAAWLSGGRPFAAGEVRGPTLRAVITRPRAAPAQRFEKVEAWHPLETVTGDLVWVGRFVGESPAPTQAGRGEPRHLEALWARGRAVGSASQVGDPGRTHKVLTPLTSILVLEKDSDYTRWGLEIPKAPEGEPVAKQKAPDQGQAQVPRPDVPQRTGLFGLQGPAEPPAPTTAAPGGPPRAEEARDRSLADLLGDGRAAKAPAPQGVAPGGGEAGPAPGIGSLGAIGKGAGSSGVGYGRAGGPPLQRRAQTPAIAIGQAEVRGSLDKEIIRRVIRRHVPEVRFCYEQELLRSPRLQGRVTVQFVISATGRVMRSTVQSSTVGNSNVEQCIARAVQRWEFPTPAGGGIVIVNYPFVLKAAEDGGGGPLMPVAPPPPIAPVVDPYTQALAILGEAGTPLEGRVARIARDLGIGATTSAQALAWSLVQDRLRTAAGHGRRGVLAVLMGRPQSQLEGYLLAALLLREAQAERDAVRVLSEAAIRDKVRTAEEMQRRGWTADAARLRALQARPSTY